MAGGRFDTENRVRAGTYINFMSEPRSTMEIGNRGVITAPIIMGWGPDGITELTAAQLADGRSEALFGTTAFEKDSLELRLALASATKGYFYRIDTGGTVAQAPIGDDGNAAAKYAGIKGNNISFSIVANDQKPGLFTVYTMYRGLRRDIQEAGNIQELKNNDFIEWSGTGPLVATVTTPLTGGTNGVVTDAGLADYLLQATKVRWNTMAIPNYNGFTSTVKKNVADYIIRQNDQFGRYVQGVLHDYVDADHETVISTIDGFEYAAAAGEEREQVTPELMPLWVASITAGAAVNQSNTYRVVANAVNILNETAEEDYEVRLKQGYFVLSRNTKGQIVVEKDINTFTSVTPTKQAEFSKNRVVRVMHDIGTQTNLIWETQYIGKVDNNTAGRVFFKNDIGDYFIKLQGINALENVDKTNDLTVSKGPRIEDVVLGAYFQPVDSVEKLYATFKTRFQ